GQPDERLKTAFFLPRVETIVSLRRKLLQRSAGGGGENLKGKRKLKVIGQADHRRRPDIVPCWPTVGPALGVAGDPAFRPPPLLELDVALGDDFCVVHKQKSAPPGFRAQRREGAREDQRNQNKRRSPQLCPRHAGTLVRRLGAVNTG